MGALLGSGAAVQIDSQVEAMGRVLLGLSCGRRGLALMVEDAEVRPPRSPSACATGSSRPMPPAPCAARA